MKNHSFIDIPLIPIVEPEGPDHIEINTKYTVTVSPSLFTVIIECCTIGLLHEYCHG